MNSAAIRFMLFVLISLWCAQAAIPANDGLRSLGVDLDRIFSDRAIARAQVGVVVYSLNRSEVLYEKNASRLFIPASCNKVITSAAALARLGPEYRFETRLVTDGPVEDGELKKNLIVVGSGDPANSARFYAGDSFAVFKKWAAALKEMEIRRISGGILGYDGAFPPPKLGSGWEWEDLAYPYAAPVTALQFNDNMIELRITPGDPQGTPASVNTFPLAGYLKVHNMIVTGPPRSRTEIRLEPRRGATEVVAARGTIPLKNAVVSQNVAARRPVAYYLAALKWVLAQEGIDVEDCETTEAKSYPATSTQLLRHKSPPLSEILKPLLKDSLNLYAETLTRTLGLVVKGEGSFAKGKEVVEETLDQMGIKKEDYRYADGSGLSRLNLQSPESLVRVLRFMYRHRSYSHFYDALPVAGVDGTLAGRMKGSKAAGNVRAKTGTISGVSAICGYVASAEREMLAFAIILNNYTGSRAAAETVQDRAMERLVNFSRK